MSNIEEMKAVELNAEELEQVVGGAYKKPAEKKGYIIYQIQPGDTLYKIAKAHKTTVDALLSYNPQITNRNLIRAGAYMYIKK